MNRQWDLAIEQQRNALELDPNYFLAYLNLGIALSQKRKV
ncbi:MAG: tetratricopeptide repeat protein [Acidobacteriia bacterium]|nr:tetratricopeptide repeat protein [Terriglobia bacterium]